MLHSMERTGPFLSKPTAENLLADARQDVDILSIKGRQFLDKEYIGKLKSAGLKVFVWTINDAARADFYESIGIDGIITDKVPSLSDSVRHCKQKGTEEQEAS